MWGMGNMYESRPIENRASEDRRSTVGRDRECIRGEYQLEDLREYLVISQLPRGSLNKDNSFQFFSVVSLAFFTLFINSLFTFYRSKHYHTPHPAPAPIPQPQYVMPPQTPRRGRSGFKWTPGDDGDGIGTPTRRRRLDDGAVPRIKGN